jgi:ABC-type Fe3+/spermidine/putrescine transport system ATPase subunit
MLQRLNIADASRSAQAGGSHLVIEGLRKRFGQAVAVDGVDLTVGQGEFVTLLGDSGCGKTTLLRMIAGFTTPDAGRILRNDEDVTHLAPAARRMGFVFQSYALFPTKTAGQNIGFAPRMAGHSRADIRDRVRDLAEMVEIDVLLDRYPHELSGGQQQRVALARALASEPDMLLLDEPMSALDARIRAKLRAELRGLVDRLGMTALYVTHDQEEALALSDRVAVMRAGRIEQIGTPNEIYHRPRSRFVAEFIGVSNILPAKAASDGVMIHGKLWPLRLPADIAEDEAVTVMIRPEHVLSCAPDAAGALPGTVETITFLGSTVRVVIACVNGLKIVAEHASTSDWAQLARQSPIAVLPDYRHLVLLDRKLS